MQKIKYFFIFYFLFASIAFTQDKLFLNEKKQEEPSFTTKIVFSFLKTQKEMTNKIILSFKKIKTEKNNKTLFFLLLLSFIYGIIHSLGPGHGKIIVASYFSTNKSLFWQAPLMAFEIAILHVFSAVILVFFVKNIAIYVFSQNKDGGLYFIEIISYLSIFLIGLFMIYQINKKEIIQEKISNKSIFLLALSVGLVPCTGALLILFFALAKNMFFIGVLSVISMSLGIALTISIIGLSSLFLREKIEIKIVRKNKILITIFKYLGPVLITLIGLILSINRIFY